MKRLLAIFALLCLCVPVYAAEKPDILEVITIDGVIDDGMAAKVTTLVQQINENKRAKAVMLEVDSPGGGVLASAVIYEELAKLKVPVVGFCQNICASGGMYVLMAPSVKFIGVRTQTISGSIGVIMHITRYNRLLDWARIDSETYKSGDRKDAGNPNRPVTEDERTLLQDEIKGLADSFYALVVKSRGAKITPEHLVDIKRAGIYFGEGGVKVGLVDQVMTKEAAEAKAKELSGSKLIFTREEVKKMSKDSDAPNPYAEAPSDKPSMLEGVYANGQYLMSWLKDIRAGATVRFEFRAPYAF